ncbi:unnamed protein product [Porites evermanni]|uniref:Uncharacterized protein n=1 Tax=Porites evermanni TaxID=104178 RepID=A0ABN8M6R0_9CNID|nr:unnamed protein product [Porites evermanni]
MSLTLSRADVSGSRDEALSSVHNQGFEVVTRSTTDIAASSTTNTLIDQSSDPLLSSAVPVFTGEDLTPKDPLERERRLQIQRRKQTKMDGDGSNKQRSRENITQ